MGAAAEAAAVVVQDSFFAAFLQSLLQSLMQSFSRVACMSPAFRRAFCFTFFTFSALFPHETVVQVEAEFVESRRVQA